MVNKKVNITFHGLDSSESLKDKIDERSSSLLNKYDSYITRMEWVVGKENPKESSGEELFKTGLTLHLKNKGEAHESSLHRDVYHTVSDVAKKAQQQLNKLKK